VPAAAGTVHAGYSRGVRSERNRRASGRPYLPRRGPQRSMRASLGGPGGVQMSSDAASSPLALVEAVPPLPSLPRLWGVVLAGGEGVRLRALARQICGDERPKQYLPLFGDRTLLRETLDRVALAIPPARTAVVTLRHHAGYVAAETRGDGRPHVLLQPQDRGTAPGILLPAQWIPLRS